MKTISRWGRFVSPAICLCVGCGGIAGVDGKINGTSNGDDSASSASSRIVDSTPFPESELWILGSDTTTGRSNLTYVSMSGVGNLLFGLEVTTNILTGAGCSMASIIPSGLPIDPSQPAASDNLTFTFDGRTLSVRAQGLDPATGAPCSVDFTARVARQGNAQVLFGFNAFDVTVQGQANVNGQPVTLAPLQLNRVRQPVPLPCDDPLSTLQGLSWSVSNMNAAATLVPPITQDVSELLYLNLYGDSDQVYSFDLNVGIDGTYCYGASGTISFDGRTLVINAQSGNSEFPDEPPTPDDFEGVTQIFQEDPGCNNSCIYIYDGECDDGREGAGTGYCAPGTDCTDCGPLIATEASLTSKTRHIFSDTGPKNPKSSAIKRIIRYVTAAAKSSSRTAQRISKPAPSLQPRPGEADEACTFNFTGTVAECGVYLPPILGGFAGATESIRIEGTGRYTTADGQTGEVNTLYLQADRGAGSGCGLGMIPMLPLMALALCAFSVQNRRRSRR